MKLKRRKPLHEFSLMSDLFCKLEDISRVNGNAKIITVRVKLGALAHITRDQFTGHFIECARGTPAEGAKLEVEQLIDTYDSNAQNVLLDSVELTI